MYCHVVSQFKSWVNEFAKREYPIHPNPTSSENKA